MVAAVLFGLICVLAAIFLASLHITAYRRRALRQNAEGIALGAAINLFDTLGIGSFSPTTAWLHL